MIDGTTYITQEDHPDLLVTPDGGVMLCVTTSSAMRWRTRAAFENWLENVTRQSAVNPPLDALRVGPTLWSGISERAS